MLKRVRFKKFTFLRSAPTPPSNDSGYQPAAYHKLNSLYQHGFELHQSLVAQEKCLWGIDGENAFFGGKNLNICQKWLIFGHFFLQTGVGGWVRQVGAIGFDKGANASMLPFWWFHWHQTGIYSGNPSCDKNMFQTYHHT